MCNCSNFNGGDDPNQFVDNEDISFDYADGLDYGSDFDDEDFEGDEDETIGDDSHHSFDGEAEFGDGEFDDFLTKRSRARRKLRKKYRKSGLSRKEARKKAVSSIPKQKLGKLLSNAIKGKTDPETNKLIKGLEKKGAIDTKKDGIDKIADQINEAVNENVEEGTQNMGTETATSETSTSETSTTTAGGGKKKMMMFVGIGAVAIIGGYFLFFRK